MQHSLFYFLFSWVFCVNKVRVYGNALVVATSASVVIVVERDIPIKECYWVCFFSYLTKAKSLKCRLDFAVVRVEWILLCKSS